MRRTGLDNFDWGVCAAALVFALLPTFGVHKSLLLYFFIFFVYLSLGAAWNLVAGYAGLVSLCPPAFFGLAGYSLAILSLLSFPLWVGVAVGAFAAVFFSMAVAVPAFRLRGIYFSIGTLVIPEAMRIVFFLWRPVKGTLHGGGAGYMVAGIDKLGMSYFYIFATLLAAASVLILKKIKESKFGLGLAAIRDNQRTAISCGINVYRLKLQSFMLSAAITGLAGGAFYLYQGYIEPSSSFNIKWTMIAMLSTVIGGMGSVMGPVVGSAFVTFLHFSLARYGNLSLLIQGAILVLIMLLLPKGIVGFFSAKFRRRHP